MKIARIDLWHVAAPLPAPFYPSWIPGFRQTENRFTLARLVTTSGIEGYSAAPAMGEERQGLGSLLGPYFLGERADDIASVRQRIREMGYLGWRVGWLEAACWDAIGKARGVPVYKLLGGTGGRVRLYASTGEVKEAKDRIPEVEARLSEGFAGVKLRVHDADPEVDIAQIRDTARAIDGRGKLMVDANQGWRVAVISDAPRWDYDRALRFCNVAAEHDYAWVEEPLPQDAYEDLAKLRANTEVNIAGGELNSQGLPEFKHMIERGCYDVYQPDAVMTGGIAETWAIMKHAEAAGAVYDPHTWTNGIGFAINLQLFAASAHRETLLLEYPFNPPGWMPEARDGLLLQPWLHDKGFLELPTTPGLGFDIDQSALRRHGTHFYTATKLRVAIRTVLDRGIAGAKDAGAKRDARLADRHKVLDAIEDPPAAALAELAPPPKAPAP